MFKFRFLNEDEYKSWKEIIETAPDEEVSIEGVVNTKTTPMSHYKVSLAYGDLRLIVAVLRDYIKEFDYLTEEGNCPINPLEYEVYYREKFMQIANRISEQIEYDYDKQVEICKKKAAKVDNSDIGEDGVTLALKRG